MKIVTGLVLGILLAQPVSAKELLQTQTSWDGGEIAYPTGQAEVSSFVLSLATGQTVGFHCHPVPTMGYVLKGAVEVETKGGHKTVLREGDAMVEVMRTLHRGHALEGDAEIVVFYAGAVDVPNTVMQEDKEASTYCLDDSAGNQ
jgi:quercetin dioxygenase-like cupin family protein